MRRINFDVKEAKATLFGIFSSIVGVFGVMYFWDFKTNWDTNIVSVPTFFIEIFKVGTYALLTPVGVIFILNLVWSVLSQIPSLFQLLKQLPLKIGNEIKIIKQIWENRGLGKYSLFGGIGFYIRLRLRVLAFFCGFLFFASLSYFVYQNYAAYEPSHWVEKVYYRSEPKVFQFKKDVPYTVCLHGSKVEYIYVNGSFFCDTKSVFSGKPNFYALTNFNPDNTFNIAFPQETRFAILLKMEMVVNDLFSAKYEIWENKQEGTEIFYTVFDPRTYTNNKSSDTQNSGKENKDKTKKTNKK